MTSTCNKCGSQYPSAPVGTVHKCGLCEDGMMVRDTYLPEITPEAFLSWARANPELLPDGVAKLLGPKRDWANELAAAWWGEQGKTLDSLATLLRTRSRPIANDISDEWLELCIRDLLVCEQNRAALKLTLRAIIKEAGA